jgi:hypothetical protein
MKHSDRSAGVSSWGYLWRTAFVALILLSVGGCGDLWSGSLRPSVNLDIAPPGGSSVHAWGYPAAKGSRVEDYFNNVDISLERGPEFRLRLPDGTYLMGPTCRVSRSR